MPNNTENLAKNPENLAKNTENLAKEPENLAKDTENLAKEPENLAKEIENLAKDPETPAKETESLANGSVEEPKPKFTAPKYYCSKCGFPVCDEKCKFSFFKFLNF